MSQEAIQPNVENAVLDENAPTVRLVAGAGTAGQKSWNLFRPATLIGSRRPAHIVLHDAGVEPAHAVVLNTCHDVLIADLHTSTGVYVNGQRLCDFHRLRNGDRVKIAETEFDVTVESKPENARRPKINAGSVAVCADDLRQLWQMPSDILMIGSHELSSLRLDHPSVAERHAVLFIFGDGLAIFDTGSETGVWLNGSKVSVAKVDPADRVLIGSNTLRTITDAGSFQPPWERPENAASAQPHSPFAKLRKPAESRDNIRSLVSELKSKDKDQQRWEAAYVVPAPPCDGSGTAGSESGSNGTQNRNGESQAEEKSILERKAMLDQREQELVQREKNLMQRWTQMLSMRCRRCGAPVKPPDIEGQDA